MNKNIKHHDPDIISSLCSLGVDANHVNYQGYTSLSAYTKSSSNPSPLIIQQLIKSGANVNHVNPQDDKTPVIYVAERFKSKQIIQTLVENGANLDFNDSQIKSNILRTYIMCHSEPDMDTVQYLLSLTLNDVELLQRKCFEALLFYVRQNNPSPTVISILLTHGCPRRYHPYQNPISVYLNNNDPFVPQVIESLVKGGIDINRPSFEGLPPLLDLACNPKNHTVEVYQTLIEQGADTSLVDSNNCNVLMIYLKYMKYNPDWSARRFDDETTRETDDWIVDYLSTQVTINHLDVLGNNVLMLYCTNNKVCHVKSSIVKLLIDAGVDVVNASSEPHHILCNYLHLHLPSSSYVDPQIITFFIKAGVDANKVFFINNKRMTALMFAICHDAPKEIMIALIRGKANSRYVDPDSGKNLLMLYIEYNSAPSVETVRNILFYCKININQVESGCHMNVLMMCLKLNVVDLVKKDRRSDIIRLLFAAGLDPLYTDKYGCNAMSVYCLYRPVSSTVVAALVKHGVDINHINLKNDNLTPLLYAVKYVHCRKLENYQALIDNGANVQVTTLEGRNVLMQYLLCEDNVYVRGQVNADKDVVKYFISHLSVNDLDLNGENALMIYCTRSLAAKIDSSIVKLLLNSGCNPILASPTPHEIISKYMHYQIRHEEKIDTFIIELLLFAGVDPNYRNDDEPSSHILVCAAKHRLCFRMFYILQHTSFRVNWNTPQPNGRTILETYITGSTDNTGNDYTNESNRESNTVRNRDRNRESNTNTDDDSIIQLDIVNYITTLSPIDLDRVDCDGMTVLMHCMQQKGEDVDDIVALLINLWK